MSEVICVMCLLRQDGEINMCYVFVRWGRTKVIHVMCVVSAGREQAINASSPARTLRSVAEREQLGVKVRGKWLYNTFGAMKQKALLTDSSEYK